MVAMGLFSRFSKRSRSSDQAEPRTVQSEAVDNEPRQAVARASEAPARAPEPIKPVEKRKRMPVKSNQEFVFLDVETPNRHNDRVCSIGVIRTDCDGLVLGKRYMLIDPDVEFDAISSSVHGINEFDVHGAPAFPEAWGELKPLVDGAIVVAHNAHFDLTVIDKTMAAYGIEHGPVRYACTMTMAREQFPDIKSSKLDDVCGRCGVALEHHHNAMDDAQACMGVFFSMGQPEEYVEYVPIDQRAHGGPVFNMARSEGTKAHNEFMMLAADVLADGHVDIKEAIGLQWWLERNKALSGDASVGKLTELLSNVLKDGVIDEQEESALLESIGRIVNPSQEVDESDNIDGMVFCLTGEFDYGSRTDVTERLESLGGIRSDNVTMKTNYVIIGAQGSAAYAHDNYGGKVKKAMEKQAKGASIKIITEEECPWL